MLGWVRSWLHWFDGDLSGCADVDDGLGVAHVLELDQLGADVVDTGGEAFAKSILEGSLAFLDVGHVGVVVAELGAAGEGQRRVGIVAMQVVEKRVEALRDGLAEEAVGFLVFLPPS